MECQPFCVCRDHINEPFTEHLAKKYLLSITGDNCCVEINWQISLGQQGWVNCSSMGRYFNGLWIKSISQHGGGDHITKGRCCTPPHEYQDETPVCQTVDWKTSSSRSVRRSISTTFVKRINLMLRAINPL